MRDITKSVKRWGLAKVLQTASSLSGRWGSCRPARQQSTFSELYGGWRRDVPVGFFVGDYHGSSYCFQAVNASANARSPGVPSSAGTARFRPPPQFRTIQVCPRDTEAYRVLAPGGRYTISHAARGPAGAPYYPLPSAREPSYSFLGTREKFLELLASVGFTKIDCRNETSEGSERSPGELSPGTILGADMPERQANAARSGKEGRLVRMFVIAQRPS